jgi:DNA-binding NtrC family response regulator
VARITAPVSHGRRLLVVDDDRELLRSAERLLRRRGYVVRAVSDSVGALSALREGFRPDGVLLDWYLQETTAEHLLPSIRELEPDAWVLIVTGWSSDQAAARAVREKGVVGIHDKGLGASALLERIEALFEGVGRS